MEKLTLTRPDDWHLHVRDGATMAALVPYTAQQFGRAIIMPNLRPPVTTTEQAIAYRQRILDAVPDNLSFDPLMSLYLTDNTPADEIDRARDSGHVFGVKLYPAGATTNSDAGVTNLERCYPVLERMSELGMVFQIHGEVTGADTDPFDREAAFIDQILAPLVQTFPNLKVVLEHITTSNAVDFVNGHGENVAATITPQHCLLNRGDMFTGGIRPHHYCLPILKREQHRQSVLAAATSGSPKFFLGTDSAPHSRDAKEQACGCAGCFSAPAAIELYAKAFETVDALDRLEGFASHFGADFYNLPRNNTQITLHRREWTVPDEYPYPEGSIVPLYAGQTLDWQMEKHA